MYEEMREEPIVQALGPINLLLLLMLYVDHVSL
jgi:hypothetical protein